jgi:hypothetical protein
VGEGSVSVCSDDLGNNDVVAPVPAVVLPFRLEVGRVGRELLKALQVVPVVDRVPACAVRRLPRLGAQEPRQGLGHLLDEPSPAREKTQEARPCNGWRLRRS